MKDALIAVCFVLTLVIAGSIIYYDQPRTESWLAAIEIRLDSLESDNVKLSQNDSTLAQVINQLYRKIKALEADTVKVRKK